MGWHFLSCDADKRRRSSAGDDGAGPAAKAALTAAEAAAASAGGPLGDDWSPLLVALREEGPQEDSRRPSKGDTESYGNDVCLLVYLRLCFAPVHVSLAFVTIDYGSPEHVARAR